MKKRLAAILCALLLMVSALPAASALEGEALRAADTLATLGLVDDAASDPESPATRSQAAVLLVNLAGAEAEAAAQSGSSAFQDVPAAIAGAVNYAAGQGWISGVTATEFRPNEPLTANAWAAFLLRMLGWSDADGDFVISGAAAFAQRIGLFPTAYTGALSQGDLWETAAAALSFSYREGDDTVITRLVDSGAVSRSAANALGLLNPALTARQIADRCAAAVFQLNLYETDAAWRDDTPTGEASGFFISADGLAVTNYHSIDGATRATVTLSTGDLYEVESVVYYDPDIDIAVIRVSRDALEGDSTTAFACLEIAPSGTGDLRMGDTVYALGSPLGLGLAVSSGVVSATEREVERYALPCVMSTADISEGSSGGALLNACGQVVAVTSGAFLYGNSMYLAVPIDPVLSADLTGQGQTLAQVAAAEAA